MKKIKRQDFDERLINVKPKSFYNVSYSFCSNVCVVKWRMKFKFVSFKQAFQLNIQNWSVFTNFQVVLNLPMKYELVTCKQDCHKIVSVIQC